MWVALLEVLRPLFQALFSELFKIWMASSEVAPQVQPKLDTLSDKTPDQLSGDLLDRYGSLIRS
jgi:hypothetical protein